MRYIGNIKLRENCDLTDPCYNKNVWCRNTIKVKPGTYHCYVIEAFRSGITISNSCIIHEDYDKECYPKYMTNLTEGKTYECGVDAGMFGYFDDKPDLNGTEWEKFCDNIKDYPAAQISQLEERDGFYTTSGYGDGVYPVTTYTAKGEVVAIATDFM